MKTLILMLSFVLFASCEKDEIPKEKETVKDCNCDRVVKTDTYYLTQGDYFYIVTTINDCTGIQRKKKGDGKGFELGTCIRF